MFEPPVHYPPQTREIALLLAEAGLTQTATASKCGMGRTTFTRIVNGIWTPSRRQLARILDAIWSLEDGR